MYYEIALERYSQQIPLKEAYFGKTPEILALEKQIGLIRKKYDDMQSQLYVNTSKELAKFNTMVEDTFGFKIFNMIIVQQGITNACTLPISSTIGAGDQRKHLIKSKNGLKYDKSANYSTSVFIFSGIFFNKDFTDGEVFAIILHEIGHNFFEAVDRVGQTISYANQLINAFTFPLQFLFTLEDPQIQGTIAMSMIPGMKDKWLKFLARKRKEDPNSCLAFDGFCATLNGIKGFFFLLGDMVNMFSAMINPVGAIQAAVYNFVIKVIALLHNPFKVVTKILGIDFRNEAHSDQFATMYGYGAELNNALTKMHKSDMGLTWRSSIRESPIFGAYFDLLSTPSYILDGIINEHPDNVYRARSTIARLRKELKKNNGFDARMKKEIESQIAQIEKNVDDLTNMNTDLGHFFTNSYRKLICTMFGGDFRGFYANNIDDAYDRVFNEL